MANTTHTPQASSTPMARVLRPNGHYTYVPVALPAHPNGRFLSVQAPTIGRNPRFRMPYSK